MFVSREANGKWNEKEWESKGHTEEIEDQATIGDATGGFTEVSAAIGEVNSDPKAGYETSSIGIGIAEIEYYWRTFTFLRERILQNVAGENGESNKVSEWRRITIFIHHITSQWNK